MKVNRYTALRNMAAALWFAGWLFPAAICFAAYYVASRSNDLWWIGAALLVTAVIVSVLLFSASETLTALVDMAMASNRMSADIEAIKQSSERTAAAVEKLAGTVKAR